MSSSSSFRCMSSSSDSGFDKESEDIVESDKLEEESLESCDYMSPLHQINLTKVCLVYLGGGGGFFYIISLNPFSDETLKLDFL